MRDLEVVVHKARVEPDDHGLGRVGVEDKSGLRELFLERFVAENEHTRRRQMGLEVVESDKGRRDDGHVIAPELVPLEERAVVVGLPRAVVRHERDTRVQIVTRVQKRRRVGKRVGLEKCRPVPVEYHHAFHVGEDPRSSVRFESKTCRAPPARRRTGAPCP